MLITDQVATAPCTDCIQARCPTFEAKQPGVCLTSQRTGLAFISRTFTYPLERGASKMGYVNLETGARINLDDLTAEDKKFYKQAMKRFRENTNWLSFDEFAFGIKSPIYNGRRSHIEVLQSALYLVLKDMSLQLGVQKALGKAVQRNRAKQGLIKRTKKTPHG